MRFGNIGLASIPFRVVETDSHNKGINSTRQTRLPAHFNRKYAGSLYLCRLELFHIRRKSSKDLVLKNIGRIGQGFMCYSHMQQL